MKRLTASDDGSVVIVDQAVAVDIPVLRVTRSYLVLSYACHVRNTILK